MGQRAGVVAPPTWALRSVAVMVVVSVAALLTGCSGPISGQRYRPGASLPPRVDIQRLAYGVELGWSPDHQKVFVTASGSFSCPTVPSSFNDQDATLALAQAVSADGSCTADISFTTTEIAAPERWRTPAPVTVKLTSGTAPQILLTIGSPPPGPAATSTATPARVAYCSSSPQLADPATQLAMADAGATPGVSAAALFMGSHPTDLTAGSSVKIVLRATGSGPLNLTFTAPSGAERKLDWGPELHTSSNFAQSGDEWGIGLSFGTPGCWTLRVARDAPGAAVFPLNVN